jgi:hypothetical protein
MSVIFLGIVGYLGSVLYERAFATDGEVPLVEEVEVKYQYPVNMVLKNTDGSVIHAIVFGRSERHVQFTRDGQEFVYPIDSLAEDVKVRLRKYPNVGIKNAAEHMAKGSLELGDLYVQELEKRVNQINDEIKDLSQRYAASVGNVEKRTIRREVEKLNAERVELQQKIAERQ